jgi:hypothetical protein
LPTRRPVLVNSEGKQLCFSSWEAQDAYVEAFADWERSGFDVEAKYRSLPKELRSVYYAGLKRAKAGEKPRYR